MSDSVRDDGMSGHGETDVSFDSDWRSREGSRDRQHDAVDWCRLAEWLARLGPALWLHRAGSDRVFPRARLSTHGVLLLDHPALAAFAGSVVIEAHGAVTSHGPREWLEFVDAQFACIARLYLLPDADYLAWDAMLGDCAIMRVAPGKPLRWRAHAAFMRCAWRRMHGSWQARIVRFPLMRLPCLQVLGVRAPAELSALGRQIAATIACDENVSLGA
ncbi:hypothetical protein [Rudaea sp.]|uniref:hypothetical protein n=1 Tax=Rudaea sp. TaxID=2136325 RepID=UPI002ED004EC